MGKLFAFEGGDGCGKSTQAKLLARRLDALLTRQAGGTDFGLRIRELTLDSHLAGMSARAEALLYMADRAEHVDSLVRPTLLSGRHVVSDRWAYSSLAYQGYARGLDVAELREISDWAVDGLWPDLVFFLDLPEEIAAVRMDERSKGPDHYESEGELFQRKIVSGYRDLARAEPSRWRNIDASKTVDEVANAIWQQVVTVL